MPDIVNLFKKTEEKKRFKKSNYRPWNFMDQMDTEERQASSSTAVILQSSEGKDGISEKKQHLLQPVLSNFHAPERLSADNNIDFRGPKKGPLPTSDNESNVDKLFRLCGYQKNLFFFIVERCFSRGMLTTGAVCNNSIAELLGTSSRMVKTTIHRLVNKNLIIRENGKRGRGGFYVFSIDESIRAASLEYTRLLDGEKTFAIKKISNSHHIDISTDNSSILTDNMSAELHEKWQALDIEPLSSVGFNTTHLSQIASQNKLSPKIVQDSIYAFAFDLQENNKAKSIKVDPINFFMGILRKGKPYAPTSNYESPQDKAMRLYRENMHAIEKKRVEAEKEAINLAFNSWFNKLTDEQKIEILPEMFRRNAIQRNANGEKPDKSKILESSAKAHFEKEIWPNEKEKIINNKTQ